MGVLHIISGKILRGAENQVFLQMLHQSNDSEYKQAGVFSSNSEILKKTRSFCTTASGRLHILNLFLLMKVCFLFKKKDFPIIHANCSKSLSFAILVKMVRGGEIIMSRRTVHPIKSLWKYKFTAKVIACSLAVKRKLENDGVSSSKIEVIYDSTSLLKKEASDFKSRNESFVLCGAALTAEKGLYDLLDAWGVFTKKKLIQNTKLLVAGEGPLKKDLQAYIDTNNILNVELLGWVEDLQSLIKTSKICVLTSHSEGLGSFLCESASLGKPLCGSRVGGIPEVILDGENGYLHDLGDVQSFANNMFKILSSEETQKQFSKASKVHADQSFSLDKNVLEVFKIYRSFSI